MKNATARCRSFREACFKARDVAEPKSVPQNRPHITPVNDEELARLRKLFADEPPTLGTLRGLGGVLEPLYPDLMREKAAKHWSWKHIAELLTKWGYPTSANYVAKVCAQIDQRRQAKSRGTTARSAPKAAPKTAALSVRRTGPAQGAKRTEVITHTAAAESAPTDTENSPGTVVPPTKVLRAGSVTPLRPFTDTESAKIVKQL